MNGAISTIIAVVSDPAERELIGASDLGPGLVAHVVSDATEADRLHMHLHADVVIASGRPPLNGIEVLSRVHRRDPDCFRVLLAPTSETDVLVRGLNLGVIDAILPSPLALEPLRTLLHQGCEAALLRRHNRSLLAELGTRNHELLELNAHLEATVQHRTRELQSALHELQHANSELKDKQSELVRLETQGHMAQLVRGLAHELNNPLAVVLGYAQRLRRTLTEPDLARRTEVIIHEATRLSALVDRLRSFAQPLEEHPEACDIAEIFRTKHAQYLSEGHAPPELIVLNEVPTVIAAPRAMSRVASALLRNAKEAGARSVIISGDAAFGRARITIANDGETPTIDQCRSAVRPFFTTRAGSGHQGLGLSVSIGLLTEMGGAIELRPRANGGAETIITLPESASHSTRQVLVIDDEPMLRELICDSLSDDGWVATGVGSLAEADALIASRPYDLLIVDRHLSDGDGIAWASQLSATHHVADRVLIITGEESIRECGLPMIAKPFQLEHLRQRVGELFAA